MNPKTVVLGKMNELHGSWERQVCSFVVKAEAMAECEGKRVRSRWVLTEKGDDVSCWFVAHGFAQGTRGMTYLLEHCRS